MKRMFLSIISLLFVSMIFTSCNSNKITEKRLEDKATQFLELYFDSSALSFESCAIEKLDISIVENYYQETFSDYFTEELLLNYTEDFYGYEMSRMVLNSFCLNEEISIDNIVITINNDINQESNLITFMLDLKFMEEEFTGLKGNIRFNSDMMIEYFHIIGI